jgi:hypothetical protein|nr:MAG TPA: hypothetical protein [Bacteriophage sp.]
MSTVMSRETLFNGYCDQEDMRLLYKIFQNN